MASRCSPTLRQAQRQPAQAQQAAAHPGCRSSARAASAARQPAARAPRCRQSAAAAAAAGSSSSSALDGAAISVSGVDLTFKGRGINKQVLNTASLAVPRGSFHMLLGANGCGKSTLLRVLAGLFRPDAGAVHVDAPCGFVFQNPDHQVVMPTVAADVAFGLGRYRLSPEAVHAAVAHSLAQVGLSEFSERPTSSLSGGQKQRVAIAGALAECPRVLLLDELTTFLDYEDQENVLQCVRRIVDGSRRQQAADAPAQQAAAALAAAAAAAAARDAGPAAAAVAAPAAPVTALWVTHRLEELEYADSVSYMEGGRIAFSGSPAEMRQYMRRLGAVV
ncbi:ABC transporter I family member chloroplastic [Micractinium conductrix]|uniref:ABC transporter I family member chloroplastic n=1 Tax=Micractinium conductrix TaxID=554055 RepID=A0A2P6VJR9_9CHLO|nr:ABC transporter I family member chloroplastic [Micractinium conductrix]|eukprot:PSC74300.1 ABC transporter I family member chloroplastic [Micractinium conductrix]